MNNYESIIIINSNLEEAVIKSSIEKVTDLIAKNGKVESTEEWGKKKLAYPIKKQAEGYYVLVNLPIRTTLFIIKSPPLNYFLTTICLITSSVML